MKEPKVCLECGKPIPEDRHPNSVVCSDACRAERILKQGRLRIRDRAGAGWENKGRRGEPGTPGMRRCAGGCGRIINDYRCPECWAKLRAANGCSVNPDESGLEEHSSWLGR